MDNTNLGISEGYTAPAESKFISHEERRYLISRAASMKYKIYSFHPRTEKNERMYWMQSGIPELDEWNKTISWAHSKRIVFVFGVEPPEEKSFVDVADVGKLIERFYQSMRKLPDGTNTEYFRLAITLDDCEKEVVSKRYIRKVEELIIMLVTKFRVQVYGYFPKDYRCEKRLYHNHVNFSDTTSSPTSPRSPKMSVPSSPPTEYQVTEAWRSKRKYNMFRFLPGGVGLIFCSVDVNVNSTNPITFSKFWSASQIRRLSRIFNKRKMICFDNYPCSEKLIQRIRRNQSEEEGEEEEEEDRSDDSDVESEGIKKQLFQLFCHRKKEFGVLKRSRIDFDFWINLRHTHSRLGDTLFIMKLFQLVLDFGSSQDIIEFPRSEEKQMELFNAANVERKQFFKLFQK